MALICMYVHHLKPFLSEERLYERILMGRAKELSNSELLAIALGEGHENYNQLKEDVDDCRNVLMHYGSYENLREATCEELMHYRGITQVKACKLLCLMEVSKRIYESFYNVNPLLDNEQKIVDFIRPKIFSSRQEILYILFLSNSLHLKGIIEFSKGTDNEVHFYMKELMRVIINGYSANVVLVHNHIEKYPEPSAQDIECTQSIEERCQFFDIRLLDHFVVSKDSHISLKRCMRERHIPKRRHKAKHP